MAINIGIYGYTDNKSIQSFYRNKPDIFNISLLKDESDLIKENNLDYLIVTKDDVNLDIFKTHFADIKIIKWVLDNESVKFREAIILKQTNDDLTNSYDLCKSKIFEEIWIPTNLKYSIDYYKYIYRTENIYIIPFLWDTIKEGSIGSFNNKKITIGVFDPNKGTSHNCLSSIITLNKISNSFDKAIIFNTNNIKSELFIKYIKSCSLLGNKLFITGSSKVYTQTECNVVLSFSENDDLSHIAFECFYYGIPFIHNSKTLKDWGFYYESYDYDKIKEHINTIKTTFNRQNYLDEHKPILYTVSMKNLSIQNYFKEKFKPIENKFYRDRKQKWYLSRKDLSEKNWMSNFEAYSNNSWTGVINGEEITHINKDTSTQCKIPTFILVNKDQLSIKLLLSIKNNYQLIEGDKLTENTNINTLSAYNHVKMWQKALETELGQGAFFVEDSITLFDNWKCIIQEFINNKNPKVVKFIAKPERFFDNSDDIKFFDCWGPFGVKGYYLSTDVIKHCVNYFKNNTLNKPFELELANILQKFYKEIYSSFPKIGL